VELDRYPEVVPAVPAAHRIEFAGRGELVLRVETDGFEQAVARSALTDVGDHQRFVDEPAELVHDVPSSVAGYHLCGRAVEATHEYRQPAKQHLLLLAEQRVRPLDRRTQRLLAAHRGAGTTGEHAEPVMQTVEDLGQRQRAHPCRGKFDRQWKTVEAS